MSEFALQEPELEIAPQQLGVMSIGIARHEGDLERGLDLTGPLC
jgi:hypothetical protein